MADSAVYIELASNNGDFFTNALLDDVMIRPQYATQKVLIGTSNGNVPTVTVTSNTLGILTTTPAYPLDVAGDINLTGTLRQNGAPYIGSQWSNNASNVFLLSSNVGIGKSNPAFRLDVTGDINFTGNLNQNGVPYIGSQWSNNSSNVYILASNVGVRTSNPAFALDVNGDVNFSGILRQSGVPYIGSQWSNNSSNIFVFGSNIGINTSNAVEDITVVGGKIYSDTQILGNSNDSLSTPSFSFREESNTGMYHPCNDTLGFVANGIEALRVTPADVRINQSMFVGSNLNVGSNIIANGNLTMNNRLFIGKLTVNRKVGGDANVTKTSILGFSNASDGIILDLGSNTPLSNQALRVTWSNTSEVMRVTGDGRVGIGRSNPGYRLDVDGNTRLNNGVIGDIGYGTAYTGFAHSNCFNTTSYALLQQDAGPTFINCGPGSTIYFRQNNSDLGLWNSDGFGVGTTSPSEKLNVVGNIKASSNIYISSRLGVNTSNPSQAVHVVGNMRLEGNLDVNGIFNTINTDVQLTDQFTVSNNGTGPALKVHQMGAQPIADFYDDSNLSMRIADGGNVGIGPSNPSYKLDVFGATKVGQKTSFYGASSYRNIILTPQAGENRCEISFEPLAEATGSNTVRGFIYKDNTGFTLGTATGGNTLFVGSNNRVGVGTTSPSFLLDVNGTSRATLRITGNGTTTSLNGAPTTSGLILTSSTQATLAAPHTSVYVNNGTFPIFQQLNWQADNVSMNYDSYFDGTVFKASGTSAAFQTYKTSSQYQINYATPTTAGSAITFLTGLAMTSNGRIGVGTTSPSSTLDVIGIASVTSNIGQSASPALLQLRNGTSNLGFFVNLPQGSYNNCIGAGDHAILAGIDSTDTGSLVLGNWGNSNAGIRIARNGNVGVGVSGTSLPAFKLDVNGTSRILVTGGASTTFVPVFTLRSDPSEAIFYWRNSNLGLDVSNPGNNLGSNKRNLIFNEYSDATSGFVGISTASPSYKLHVNGTIYATGDVICFSDKRLKSNITIIDSALSKLHKLNGYTFKMQNDETQKMHTGLIAQELIEVLPEAVYKENKEDGEGYYSVAYGNMAGLFVEAIKELDNKYKKENEALREEIAQLRQLLEIRTTA